MKRFFLAVFSALLLLSASAWAEIDLKPYEIPSAVHASYTILFHPGMYLVQNNGVINDGQAPTSVTLWNNGQKTYEKVFDDDAELRLFDIFALDESTMGYILFKWESEDLFRQYVQITANGDKPLFTLPSDAISPWLFSGGVYAIRQGNGDQNASVCLYDEQGHLQFEAPLNTARPSGLGYAPLPDGSLSILVRDYFFEEGSIASLYRIQPDGSSTSVKLAQADDITPLSGQLFDDGSGVVVLHTSDDSRYFYDKLIRFDAQGRILWAKALRADKTIVSVSHMKLCGDSLWFYGTAMANSRKLFTVFKLEIDASGSIVSRDIRDFTTRSTYLYTVTLDMQDNLYAQTLSSDPDHLVAAVPFEDLPIHDDPGLVLE